MSIMKKNKIAEVLNIAEFANANTGSLQFD